jgi:hypothetical protein
VTQAQFNIDMLGQLAAVAKSNMLLWQAPTIVPEGYYLQRLKRIYGALQAARRWHFFHLRMDGEEWLPHSQ